MHLKSYEESRAKVKFQTVPAKACRALFNGNNSRGCRDGSIFHHIELSSCVGKLWLIYQTSRWTSRCLFLLFPYLAPGFITPHTHTLCRGDWAAVISVWQEFPSSPLQPQVTCSCLPAWTDNIPAAACMLQLWTLGLSSVGIWNHCSDCT